MSHARLFAAGAAHIDRRGRVEGGYVPAASNPGTMREEIGGGAFNALRNAARHGVAGALMSLRGGDLGGEAVARAIADAGIEDLSAIFLDRTTPSYTALIDAGGALIAGLADMMLYDTGFIRQMRRRRIRDAVSSADALLCDANMPADAIAAFCGLAGSRPVHAIAISPAKVARLAGVLGCLSCLFMNAREARALSGLAVEASAADHARGLRARGLARGVITAGGAALTGFDPDGLFTVMPPVPRAVVDETGAGDAVAGVTVAKLMAGMPFREAVRHGMAAAMLTIERPAVIADYDEDAFDAARALVGEPLPVA